MDRFRPHAMIAPLAKRGNLKQFSNQKIVRRSLVGFFVAIASAFVAVSTLENYEKNIPLFEYRFIPDHERQLLTTHEKALQPYNEEPPIGTGEKKTTVLLGIFSTTGEKYAQRRRYIRDTYLAYDDPRICKLKEYKRQMLEEPDNVVCQVPYTFVIGAGGKDRPTDHDDEESLTLSKDQFGRKCLEEDITYLNIKENMENGKSPTWFKFGASISESYDIDYIAKIDDDSVLSPELMFQFIADELPPMPYNRRIYGGTGWASKAKNVLYAAGQFYFMSSDLANYVGNQLTAKDRLEMQHSYRATEDADMGVFIFSHPRPVKFFNLSMYKFWAHPLKYEKKFRKAYDAIDQLPRAGRMLPLDVLCPVFLKGGGL